MFRNQTLLILITIWNFWISCVQILRWHQQLIDEYVHFSYVIVCYISMWLFQNNPSLKNSLLPAGVLNKVNKSAAGTSDQMVVNLPNFPNVQLSNQNLAISLPGMSNSIPPITSSVMTNHNVLTSSCKLSSSKIYVICKNVRSIPNWSVVTFDFHLYLWTSQVKAPEGVNPSFRDWTKNNRSMELSKMLTSLI